MTAPAGGHDCGVLLHPTALPGSPVCGTLGAAARDWVALLGREQVEWLEQPSLGAEDFAHLLTETRGTMFRLGVAGAEGCTPLHSNTFAPDESSIPVGVRVLTGSLLAAMERTPL